jgi:hypothetical protein
VDELTDKEFAELISLPKDKWTAPKEKARGEYWPVGQGQKQLENTRNPAGKKRDSVLRQEVRSGAAGFVKRADRSDTQICDIGEDCYPYPHSILDLYYTYKDVAW